MQILLLCQSHCAHRNVLRNVSVRSDIEIPIRIQNALSNTSIGITPEIIAMTVEDESALAAARSGAWKGLIHSESIHVPVFWPGCAVAR